MRTVWSKQFLACWVAAVSYWSHNFTAHYQLQKGGRKTRGPTKGLYQSLRAPVQFFIFVPHTEIPAYRSFFFFLLDIIALLKRSNSDPPDSLAGGPRLINRQPFDIVESMWPPALQAGLPLCVLALLLPSQHFMLAVQQLNWSKQQNDGIELEYHLVRSSYILAASHWVSLENTSWWCRWVRFRCGVGVGLWDHPCVLIWETTCLVPHQLCLDSFLIFGGPYFLFLCWRRFQSTFALMDSALSWRSELKNASYVRNYYVKTNNHIFYTLKFF